MMRAVQNAPLWSPPEPLVIVEVRRRATSPVEELEYVGNQPVVVLEDGAVTGIGVDRRLRVLDPPMEILDWCRHRALRTLLSRRPQVPDGRRRRASVA